MMTPVKVVKAFVGLEPKTSEWSLVRDSVLSEIDEMKKKDILGIGVLTWAANCCRLQLDVLELQLGVCQEGK